MGSIQPSRAARASSVRHHMTVIPVKVFLYVQMWLEKSFSTVNSVFTRCHFMPIINTDAARVSLPETAVGARPSSPSSGLQEILHNCQHCVFICSKARIKNF